MEAIRRWEDVAKAFPNFSLGYIAKGHILQDLGNLDEAEAIFRAAMRRFPDDEWAAVRYAGFAGGASVMGRTYKAAGLDPWTVGVGSRRDERPPRPRPQNRAHGGSRSLSASQIAIRRM